MTDTEKKETIEVLEYIIKSGIGTIAVYPNLRTEYRAIKRAIEELKKRPCTGEWIKETYKVCGCSTSDYSTHGCEIQEYYVDGLEKTCPLASEKTRIVCSVCGKPLMNSTYEDFCPKCGADMRKKEETA